MSVQKRTDTCQCGFSLSFIKYLKMNFEEDFLWWEAQKGFSLQKAVIPIHLGGCTSREGPGFPLSSQE